MSAKSKETAPQGFDEQGWPLPEVRSMMIDNFARSWLNHKLAVVILFVAAAGLTTFGSWLVTPTWEGFGQIVVHPTAMPSLSIVGSTTQESAPLTATQLVKNLVGQAQSYSFLEDVVDRSELDKHLEAVSKDKKNFRERTKRLIGSTVKLQFLRGGGGDRSAQAFKIKALSELSKSWLRITSSEGSTVLPVYVYGDDPKITIKVGNAVMDLMQERMDRALRAAANRQLQTLNTLEGNALDAIAENDQAMEGIRREYEFFDPQSYAQEVQIALTGLQQEKTNYRSRVDALDAEIALLDEQLKAIPEIRDLLRESEQLKPELRLSTNLKSQIAVLDAEIASKTATKGALSPDIKGLKAQRDSLQGDLEKALSDEAGQPSTGNASNQVVDQRYQAAYTRRMEAEVSKASMAARYAGLDAAIAALREMQSNALSADLKIKRLERKAEADEAQYKSLTSQRRQLESILAQENLFTGVVERSDTAVLNEKKSDYPNNMLAMILAVALGLFASLLLPIAYDYLNQTLLTSRQASTIPGLRVVAAVPRGKVSKLFASV